MMAHMSCNSTAMGLKVFAFATTMLMLPLMLVV
jgi:hypothetical protein